jgi:hypothetical protein
MKNDWHKFNPKDRTTHPRENSRVQMKCADGTQVSGGYLKGSFLHGGVISVAAIHQTTHWRYAE